MKKWYQSKTLWLNAAATAIAIIQGLQGTSWIKPELQILILTVLNAALRFMTSEPISGTPAAAKMSSAKKGSR